MPALFETIVKFFVPLRSTAAIRFSGIPHSPKPPIRIVIPSLRFSMALSAEMMRLSMAVYCVRSRVAAESDNLFRQEPLGRRSVTLFKNIHATEFLLIVYRVRWRRRSRLPGPAKLAVPAVRQCGARKVREKRQESPDSSEPYRATGCRSFPPSAASPVTQDPLV